MRQYGQLRLVDFPVHLVHEREVNAGDELDSGRSVRVVITAGDLEAVDTVLVYGLLKVATCICQISPMNRGGLCI